MNDNTMCFNHAYWFQNLTRSRGMSINHHCRVLTIKDGQLLLVVKSNLTALQ